jgi:hypothetical protein
VTADDCASDDPRRVSAVAVHADDVVSAVETTRRGADERVVLRVTPPFSGRMRARLHVDQGIDDDTVHLPPERLVADPPPLPTPDDTADELRAVPDVEYTPERHRRRHEAAVEAWRRAVHERIVDRVALTDDHAVDVVVVGDG